MTYYVGWNAEETTMPEPYIQHMNNRTHWLNRMVFFNSSTAKHEFWYSQFIQVVNNLDLYLWMWCYMYSIYLSIVGAHYYINCLRIIILSIYLSIYLSINHFILFYVVFYSLHLIFLWCECLCLWSFTYFYLTILFTNLLNFVLTRYCALWYTFCQRAALSQISCLLVCGASSGCSDQVQLIC